MNRLFLIYFDQDNELVTNQNDDLIDKETFLSNK